MPTLFILLFRFRCFKVFGQCRIRQIIRFLPGAFRLSQKADAFNP
jgi:hypothetical protein